MFPESFNGLFRDQRPTSTGSRMSFAKESHYGWRQNYNEYHPHSVLNYQMPSKFAAWWWNGDITNR
ncbi:integrase core domain-containing protein [Escherichia coli]